MPLRARPDISLLTLLVTMMSLSAILSGCSGGAADDAAADATPVAEPAEADPGPDIPPPLTEAEIAAMDKQEMLAMLQRVSAAQRHALETRDAALRERLKKDFDLLMDRIKQTPGRVATGGADEPPAIPEPLDEAAVDGMTRADVLDALADVSRARRWAETEGDQELATRLKRDFDLLMSRVRQ